MKKELLPLDHHGIGFDLKYVYKIYKIRCPRNARYRGAMGGFAAAHRRCLVGISARVLLVVPVPVPVLVPVVLLAPLVCDSTNRAENTSLPIYGSVQKYTPDTNHETRSIFHLIERIIYFQDYFFKKKKKSLLVSVQAGASLN